MDQDVKVKWVEALRSSKFIQGRGFLKQIDNNGSCTHCCLGVLAEICNIKNNATPHDSDFIKSISFFKFNNGLMPMSDRVPSGFQGLEPWVIQELVSRNDYGISFSKNADWIEDNL